MIILRTSMTLFTSSLLLCNWDRDPTKTKALTWESVQSLILFWTQKKFEKKKNYWRGKTKWTLWIKYLDKLNHVLSAFLFYVFFKTTEKDP